jgi:hypothetical protein
MASNSDNLLEQLIKAENSHDIASAGTSAIAVAKAI